MLIIKHSSFTVRRLGGGAAGSSFRSAHADMRRCGVSDSKKFFCGAPWPNREIEKETLNPNSTRTASAPEGQSIHVRFAWLDRF